MTIWIDAHLSPSLALWINKSFQGIEVRSLGLHGADDDEIFIKAKEANAVLMTKDADFINFLERFGPPPHVIWLTCGNTSNARLKEIFSTNFLKIINALKNNEAFVEVRGL